MVPVKPVAPVLPVAPVNPVTPVAPVLPVAPIDPVKPVVPSGPVAPVSPVPVAPVAPVIPVSPMPALPLPLTINCKFGPLTEDPIGEILRITRFPVSQTYILLLESTTIPVIYVNFVNCANPSKIP